MTLRKPQFIVSLRRQPPVRLPRGNWRAAPDGHRLSVRVDRGELWFESTDLDLANSAEALGSAFLIPAAAAGRGLAFATLVDAVWLESVRGVQQLIETWWSYRGPAPVATPMPPSPQPSSRGVALCFTGGVDSFHSLLRGGQLITHLLFIHGYDIPLGEVRRAEAAEQSFRRIAAALGLRGAWLRTNLRAHRLFGRATWEHTHGGALAAAGHLLADHVGRQLISASYPAVFDRPWGSHWKLDPHWSSSRLRVEHVGAEQWRAEKLVAIMGERLVRQHLRVCWENRSPTGNCGQCEKCLRTMLVLEGHGCLGEFPVFPAAATLAANLDRLPALKPDLIRVYAGFLELDLSQQVRAALAALLGRSEPQPLRYAER